MKFKRKNAMVYALLKGLQAEFFGIFVMIFFWGVAKFMRLFANIMFGFTGLMCVVCILADFGLKQGNQAASADKLHDDDVGRQFGWKLGFIAMAPFALTALILFISKLSGAFDFLAVYKILNACLFPLMDIFAHSPDIRDFRMGVFGLILPYLALFPVSTFIGFKWGYDQVDLKDKFVYKKK
ncbi:hypothetical protein [Ruminococcus sp.]|uniref:hypothetical protein n=1 Tax=Ruminococcus sp. TaxID=41978 RepID=UPI0025F4C185|nr:hypothetical protein [Ruminococcus sp.]MBQ8966423.1 hypothetical protein [Ruminococcus sp.]